MKLLFLFFLPNILFADVYVKSLTSAETKKLSSLQKPPSLILLFQSNCQACKKQIKDLYCLEDKIRIQLFASQGSEKELQREYLGFHVDYPAFYASEDILKALDIREDSTPQILYQGEDKKMRFLGYQSCISLQKAMGI